jgi:hypothetical protein
MKKILFLSLFTISSFALASLEHKEGQGAKPSSERLSRARGCFAEIYDLGCNHPREGQEKFNTCLSEQNAMLSKSCQAFFTKLYGTKIKREI